MQKREKENKQWVSKSTKTENQSFSLTAMVSSLTEMTAWLTLTYISNEYEHRKSTMLYGELYFWTATING